MGEQEAKLIIFPTYSGEPHVEKGKVSSKDIVDTYPIGTYLYSVMDRTWYEVVADHLPVISQTTRTASKSIRYAKSHLVPNKYKTWVLVYGI